MGSLGGSHHRGAVQSDKGFVMLFRRVSRNGLVLIVAFGLLVAAVWLVVSNQARAASSGDTVYVATGENFPDALGGGSVAAMVKGPVLLVRQGSIPAPTAAELTRLSPDTIVIIGGTGVVSAGVETALGAFASTVVRIGGTDRYDTAAQLSAATFPATFDADTLNGNDSADFLGSTVKTRYLTVSVNDGSDASANVSCNVGETLIGGGAALSSFASDVSIIASRPSTATGFNPANGGSFTRWRATAVNPAGGTGTIELNTFAVCVGNPLGITLGTEEPAPDEPIGP